MRLISIRNDGFTLIEFLMALVLITILAVLSINSLTSTVNESRFDETIRRMQVLRKGLVGDVSLKTGKTRSDFGFLGDVGAIPTAAQGLSALITNPGVPAGGWTINSTARFGIGWNGPYIKSDDTGTTYLNDAWGNPFIYTPTATPPTLVSLGADRAAGGTGYARDITLQLPVNTLLSTVHGFILKSGVQWSGSADIVLNYADGTGALAQQTVSITSTDKGHFSFSNVPMGVRSATVYVPNKTSPTITIGPSLFTVDQPYYVIQANFFDLAPVDVGPTNLEVPIEMLDYGISSAVLGLFTTFERSRTALTTTDYDGTVTYSFEIVASNTGLLPQTVWLINSSNGILASVSLPGSSSTTRYRTSFTPTTGSDTYRIQLPITTLLDQLSITEARIIVDQVGATKTKVYVPLTAANTTLVNSADTVYIDTSSSTTYGQTTPIDYSIWRKNDSVLSLASGNAFTLDIVLATGTLGGTASAALFDRTSGLAVTGASVSSTSNTLSQQLVSFSDTATNFTDLDEFEVRIKSASTLQQAIIAKAGLWIALSSLGYGEVYYRTGRSYTGTASVFTDGQRALINSSLYSNATIYNETVSSSSTTAGTSISLFDTTTNDTGTTGSAVSGSALTAATTKSRQRTSAVTLTPSNRFIDKITTTTATSNVTSGTAIIQFHH